MWLNWLERITPAVDPRASAAVASWLSAATCLCAEKRSRTGSADGPAESVAQTTSRELHHLHPAANHKQIEVFRWRGVLSSRAIFGTEDEEAKYQAEGPLKAGTHCPLHRKHRHR
ncbi:hypothetical protein EYF80_035772 [Liparis tanakae]|uniref:Uncharacterized protein n=1 Tax=Liparis tanakae TaxID=230148 RepID=A0A4Z2GMI8_9TELE|nr:hypothetical protein EYF80_035772 [Liparis tanakae]